MNDNNGDDKHEEFAPKIDKLCCLAAQWFEQASLQNPGTSRKKAVSMSVAACLARSPN